MSGYGPYDIEDQSVSRMVLDDTTRCPVGDQCETCQGADDLAAATIETPVGVLCVTMCVDCGEAENVPRIRSWTIACERVADHCGHLGIDLDQAAALLEAERGER